MRTHYLMMVPSLILYLWWDPYLGPHLHLLHHNLKGTLVDGTNGLTLHLKIMLARATGMLSKDMYLLKVLTCPLTTRICHLRRLTVQLLDLYLE